MSIFSTYQWLQVCSGIELHILPDGQFECRMCSVSTSKNSLSIDEKREVKGDMAAILKILPPRQPLALSITGKGVLIKKVTRQDDGGTVPLGEVFPNLDPGQFYAQQFEGAGVSFISIVRKEILDELLKAISAAGRQVLLISLGAFSVSNVLSQVNSYGEELCFNGHQIQYTKEYEWIDYRYLAGLSSDFPLKIDIEPLQEQYLIAYATAFQLALFHRVNPVALQGGPAEAELQEFQQKQTFRFRAAVILSGLFVLLLVNFVLFTHYTSENDKMLSRVSRSTADVQSFQHIERETARYEQVLEEMGWYKGIRYSWIADQVGKSVPPSVKLRELSISPENTKETSRQRKDVFETGKIRIEGETAELREINEWIYRLKDWAWVKQVKLESFSPGQDGDTQEFTITILY